MIVQDRSLVMKAPRLRRGRSAVNPDVAAASLQGTLAELTRMHQVGVMPGPAVRWQGELVTFFHRLVGWLFLPDQLAFV
jgi:hypothetical protein